MPRQKLTDKDIFFDYRKLYRSALISYVEYSISMGLIFYLYSFIFKIIIFVYFLWALLAVCLIGSTITATIGYYKIKNGKFYIVTDKVIGYDIERSGYKGGPASSALVFKSYSNYVLPKIEYYKWSDMYRMSWNSVYHSSNVNDEFYLVTLDKKEISYIYNTKYFEYVGNAPILH